MLKIRPLPFRPKYLCAFIIIILCVITANAQAPSRDLFNIVFENNFEDNQTGDYQSQDFYRDWVNPDAILRNTTVDIIQENSNKFMRGYYPAGSLSPHQGGYLWESDISGQQNEIYFSYDIRFKPGFQWVIGGKIPGVAGGYSPAGIIPAFNDGFTVRLMWGADGYLLMYVYHHDQTIIWGSSWKWSDFRFQTGKWYNLTIRIVTNTVGTTKGDNNAILEGFIDGKLMFQKSDLRFRNVNTIYPDRILIESFFGGNTDDYRAQADEYIDIDNYVLFTYKSTTTNVPQGRSLSNWSKALLHPYYNFGNIVNTGTLPQAPSALKTEEVTGSSVSVTWQDNSANEEGFVVSRSLAADPGNTVDINLPANNTTFVDQGVKSGTTYVYTVKAVNEAGVSPYSNKAVAATLSKAETKRYREGLLAYYNFAYNPELVAYDVSGYGEPLNLRMVQSSSYQWKKEGELTLQSNASLASFNQARKIVQDIKSTNEFSFECWIRPLEPDAPGTSRVLSLGSSDYNIGFVLDQKYDNGNSGKSLVYTARLNTESTSQTGYPVLTQSESAGTGINLHHIVFVRSASGNERLWVDGNIVAEGFRPGNLNSWSESFFLRMGNESDLTLPWKGCLYVVAIYKKALGKDAILKNYSAGPRDYIVDKSISYRLNSYPNPVDDLASIEVIPLESSDLAAPASVRIMDSNGKLLLQESIFNPNDTYRKTFDFESLSSGIYLLQVLSGSKSESFKIIKK